MTELEEFLKYTKRLTKLEDLPNRFEYSWTEKVTYYYKILIEEIIRIRRLSLLVGANN